MPPYQRVEWDSARENNREFCGVSRAARAAIRDIIHAEQGSKNVNQAGGEDASPSGHAKQSPRGSSARILLRAPIMTRGMVNAQGNQDGYLRHMAS